LGAARRFHVNGSCKVSEFHFPLAVESYLGGCRYQKGFDAMRSWTTKEAKLVLEWARQPDEERTHIDEVADDSQAFDSAQYEMQHEVEAYDEAPADSLESAALRGALEHEASDEDFAPQAGHAYARPLYPQGLAPPTSKPCLSRALRSTSPDSAKCCRAGTISSNWIRK